MISSAKAVACVLQHGRGQMIMAQRLGTGFAHASRGKKQAPNGKYAQHDLHSSVNESSGYANYRTMPASAITARPSESGSRSNDGFTIAKDGTNESTAASQQARSRHPHIHHFLTFD
jgi:hypothetical protein